MKVYFKFLIISVLVISCLNEISKDKNQIVTFNLKAVPKTSKIKLSDLGFVDIEYIPLETNAQSMISRIDGITLNWGNYRIIAGDSYYLIKLWNTILMFKSDGSFVNTIGVEGKGPKEFVFAHDVDINTEDHNIYLVSAWQKKFNVYSESGDFIRTFKMPLYAPIDFRFIEGNILCYCDNLQGNIENSFVLLDTIGRIIKSFPNRYPFNKHKDGAFGFPHENLFYHFNNQLYKKELYSDTVYLFEHMDFKPHLVIELGERVITPEKRSEFDGMYIGEHYILPLNLFEFGDFVYYGFIYKFKLPDRPTLLGFIGSKKNDFHALIDLEQGLINDLDGGPNILPITIKDDNTIIALIDPLKLKTHIDSEVFKNTTPKYPEKKKELEILANSLKETDNPVLMLVRLKK